MYSLDAYTVQIILETNSNVLPFFSIINELNKILCPVLILWEYENHDVIVQESFIPKTLQRYH